MSGHFTQISDHLFVHHSCVNVGIIRNGNLAMLIDWIGQYSERNDTFSYAAHKQFYDSYHGHKKMITQNVPTEQC